MWPFKRKIKHMSNDEIADIIDATADVMDKNGQTTGKLWEGSSNYRGGPVCLIGAFGVATNNANATKVHEIIKTHPAALAIADNLGDGSSPFFAMSLFNDNEAINARFNSIRMPNIPTGKEVVVSRLRKIANGLRTPPTTNIVEVADTQNDVELVGGPSV